MNWDGTHLGDTINIPDEMTGMPTSEIWGAIQIFRVEKSPNSSLVLNQILSAVCPLYVEMKRMGSIQHWPTKKQVLIHMLYYYIQWFQLRIVVLRI